MGIVDWLQFSVEIRLSVGIALVIVCHIVYFHAIPKIFDWCVAMINNHDDGYWNSNLHADDSIIYCV